MPRVSDEHKAERKEQILTAAIGCFAKEGFHKTTMANVIAESGLSAGAVYSYFRGKEELIREIAELTIGGVGAQLQHLAEGPEPVDPVAAFEFALRHIEAISETSDVDITRVAVQAWAEACRDDAVHEIAHARGRALREGWVAVLRRAQADGNLAADADPEAVAQVLLGALPGFVVQRLIMGDVTAASYVTGLRGLLLAP